MLWWGRGLKTAHQDELLVRKGSQDRKPTFYYLDPGGGRKKGGTGPVMSAAAAAAQICFHLSRGIGVRMDILARGYVQGVA